VISDHNFLKALLSDNASAGRPRNPIFNALGEDRGLLNTEGPMWEEQRRFTVRKLRDMGLFKSSIENITLEEVKTTLKHFELYANKGDPISDKQMMFNGAVINTLWAIVAGERHDWDGPVPLHVLTVVDDLIKNMNRMAVIGLYFVPGLRHIAPGFTGWKAYVNCVVDLKKLIDDTVAKHTDNHDPNNLQ